MVIAGGAAAPNLGAERLLGLRPFRQLGRISYSLYLWHWPILILAAESQGRTSLPLSSNLAWLLVALVASIVTYLLVENPIRHSVWMRRRRVASVGVGVRLIALTLFVATVESALGGPTTPVLGTAPASSTADLATVEQLNPAEAPGDQICPRPCTTTATERRQHRLPAFISLLADWIRTDEDETVSLRGSSRLSVHGALRGLTLRHVVAKPSMT